MKKLKIALEVFRASQKGDKSKLVDLLAKEPHAVKMKVEGLTALHGASVSKDPEIFQILIDHGADIHAKDPGGYTALDGAVYHGSKEVVEMLFLHGAELHPDENLLSAAKYGHEDIVRYLLEHGANPNFLNQRGETPLVHAAMGIKDRKDRSGIVEILLSNNADPNIGRLYYVRMTPLHAAANWGNTRMMQALLDHKASARALDMDERTPLHLAALRGHKSACELLLARGAEPNPRDKEGKTPRQLAAETSMSEVVELFSNIR